MVSSRRPRSSSDEVVIDVGAGQVRAAASLRAPGFSVEELLVEARAVCDPLYRGVVESLPGEIRRVVGYHRGWWEADGTPSQAPGKAVRPALVLAAARAAGAFEPAAAAVAAVAVELVHDFSLLQDDVMDADVMRRHRPAAWTVFGPGQAILAGDVLMVAALEQLAPLPGGAVMTTVLTRSLRQLCEGQSLDLIFGQREHVSLGECMQMVEGKTGALLGAACELGALAAGADPGTALCYRKFGNQLGIAFQLVDDLLGIWGDPRVTGKPVGSDLAAGKRTFPLVVALEADTLASRHLARLYIGGSPQPTRPGDAVGSGRERERLDAATVARCAELIEAAGGRAWTRAEADRRLDQAFVLLNAARPTPDGLADLETLAALLSHRDH